MANDELRTLVREVVRQALAESKLVDAPLSYRAPWTGVEYEAHPSRSQFNIAEATSAADELLELVESKLCSIETTRLCDHCGMCRSLGF